jgi:predicted extracellular nuclease
VGCLNGENKDVQVERLDRVLNRDKTLVDDDVGDGKLARMAQLIVTNLRAPDIVAMQEIQDNDGAEQSAEVDASKTWQAIIDAVVKAGGPRYAYVDRPPVNNAEGGMPGANIRNGFLYHPKRVTLDPASVTRMNDPAFVGARVPLVATFSFAHGALTERVTLASVHNKSKRGGEGQTSAARDAQEVAINQWAKKNAPRNAHEHLGVYGDRNAYADEPAMQIEQKDGALVLLSGQLPAEDRYTTHHGGAVGELDHVAVKTNAPVEIDIVHTNADFDHKVRSGDHDGVVTAWSFDP